MKEKEWRQLVSRAAQGDGKAFEALYKETSKTVYFICLKLLGNEHNAKDAAQETYLTAYGKLSSLDDGANFPKWVNGIAVNLCKRSFRHEADISLDERLEQGEQIADYESFIPEDYVTDAEKRMIIMDIIDHRLSDIRRQTIILYYFNGLTTKEIASVMDCPEGTVTYRLSAARADIKEAVLMYEKEHDERLHAVIPVPILTRIFRAEADRTTPPDITLFNKPAASKTPADILQAGGKKTMLTLKVKIITAVIAILLAGGGIAAVVLMNGDNDALPVDDAVSSVAVDDSSEDGDLSDENSTATATVTTTTTAQAAADSLPEETTTTTTTAPEESTADTEKPTETTASEAPVTTTKPTTEATTKATTTTKAPATTTKATTKAPTTTTKATTTAPAAPKIVDSDKCGENVSWTLDENGLLTISGTGEMTEFYWHDMYGRQWDISAVKKVVISSGVTNVGLATHENMTSVTIPNTVKAFRRFAFLGCTNLKSVTMPNSVTEFGTQVFQGCTSLESVTLPSNITLIPGGTFAYCSSLKSITIPNGVTTIGGEAFRNCTSLENVTIPSSVTTIVYVAFENCESLKSITIPNSVTEIQPSAFNGCPNLTIKGKAGSAAEQYAKDNGINFVAI